MKTTLKDAYNTIELINKGSKQFSSDVNDVGTPVKKNDELWNSVSVLIKNFGVKESRRENKTKNGRTVINMVKLMNKDVKGKMNRFLVGFTLTKGNKVMDGFINVTKI